MQSQLNHLTSQNHTYKTRYDEMKKKLNEAEKANQAFLSYFGGNISYEKKQLDKIKSVKDIFNKNSDKSNDDSENKYEESENNVRNSHSNENMILWAQPVPTFAK